MRKFLLAAAGLSVMGAAAILPAAAQAQQTQLFNGFVNHNSAMHAKLMVPYLNAITKATEGRVKFNIAPNNLAPPPEQMNMVRSGIADTAYMFIAFLEQSNPTLQVSLLPGLNSTGQADAVALWRTYEKFFKQKNPIKGVKFLGFFGTPAAQIINIKKEPIRSLAFYKGKKVWSLPGIASQAMAATGAVVVPGPAVRVHEIVSKGVVDAFCCIDFENLEAVKVMDYVGAVTEVDGGVFAAKFAVFMNERKWNAIAAKDREAIEKLSGEALALRSIEIDRTAEAAQKAYLAKGGIVEKAAPAFNAELKKIWSPLQEKWFARMQKMGIDGKAALAFYQAEAARARGGK
ncbi:MAG: hypothetical protein AB7F96_18130 [Beijerinckiaceae bacterium]